MDVDKIEQGFRLVLEGLGLDASHPHLRDSPRRTAEAWRDDLARGLLETDFALDVFPVEEGYQSGLVLLKQIPVKSICAHHLLPFYGHAAVGYYPGRSLCGLSGLSRATNHFARRPQLQEHLTNDVAQFLMAALHPQGVGVVVQASHFCMTMRGVNHPGVMTTSCLLGSFQEDPAVRQEFLAAARGELGPQVAG